MCMDECRWVERVRELEDLCVWMSAGEWKEESLKIYVYG